MTVKDQNGTLMEDFFNPNTTDTNHRRRNADNSSSSSSSSSDNAGLIEGAVLGVVAILFSSTLSTLALNVALASLRVLAITTAAGALGVTTLGTGYLVVRGGQLVIQAAKPGVIDTIRAANRVARDARANALVVFDTAGNIVGGVAQTVGGTVQAAGNTVSAGVTATAGAVESAAENVAQVAQAALRTGESVRISRLQDIVGQGLVLMPQFHGLRFPTRDARAGGGFTAAAAAAADGLSIRNEDRDNGIAEIVADNVVELHWIIRRGDLEHTAHTSSSTSNPADPLTTGDCVDGNGDLANAVRALSLSYPGEIDDDGTVLAGPSGTNGSSDASNDEEDFDGFEWIRMHDYEGSVRSIGSSQDELSFHTAPSPEDREADQSTPDG